MRKFYIEYLIAQHGLEKDREGIFEADTPMLAVNAAFRNVYNILDVVSVADITSEDQDEHFNVDLEEWV